MKKILALVLSAVMLLSLCACGKAAQSSYSTANVATDQAAPAEAPMMYEPMPEPEFYAEEGFGGFAVDSGETLDTAADPTADPAYDKIIYSANATVETTEFDQTITALDGLLKQYGGFVQSSSVNGSNYYNRSRGYESLRSAYYTIRIPGSSFSELMGRLSTLGNVPYSNTYTDNITSQYYDTDARLTAYKTQETRLLEMMEIAETVEDVITIEDRLTELRYQIERLQSQLNNWDRQVNYSTLELSIEEVREYTPEVFEKVSFGRQMWLSLRDGFKDFVEFMKDLLLVLLASLPVLIFLGVPCFFIVRAIRRRRKAKRAAKAAKAEKTE